MLHLKTETEIQKFDIDQEICDSFQKKIMFYTTPSHEFFTMFCILDFQNKELKMIRTDLEANIDAIKSYDEELLGMTSHSATALNSEGFYCMPFNRVYSRCFRYIHPATNTMKVIFGKDLNHPDSKHWNRVSASFQKPVGEQHLLIGFLRDDKNVVDVVKVDEDLNATKLYSIPDMVEPPHELAQFGDLVVATSFHVFKCRDLNTGKYYQYPDQLLKDGYDIRESLPDHIKVYPGEMYSHNLKTGKTTKIVVDCPPTAHFDSDRKNHLFSSAHNLTALGGRYYFPGPAKITRWKIFDGMMIKDSEFQHPEVFRCTTHVYFEFENKTYLATIGYPNRLVFIDAVSMKLAHFHDLEENLLSGHDDPAEFVNRVHRTNSVIDKYCLNDINVSSDGRYVIYFEKDKAKFYDFKNKEDVEQYIPFPSDPAYKDDLFRTILHTAVLR